MLLRIDVEMHVMSLEDHDEWQRRAPRRAACGLFKLDAWRTKLVLEASVEADIAHCRA